MACLSAQPSIVFLWSDSTLLGWRYGQVLTRVLMYTVCGSVMSPFFWFQGGNVFDKREYDHFDTVEFWGVVGCGFRLAVVCKLGVWKRVGF